MSLINLLEQSKTVALAKREELAAQAALDVADFEEYGADMEKALDEEEMLAMEEALRLGMRLDEDEDAAATERAKADFDLAKEVLALDEGLDDACSKDELIARQLESQLKKAKLEKRERELQQKKMCKGDWYVAEQLAIEIEREVAQLEREERRDRQLARKLVKTESKLLTQLPQTEEKLRTMAREVNGENVPLRTRLRAKLGAMRKSLGEITNNTAQQLTRHLDAAA
jgi:hypothetical protein